MAEYLCNGYNCECGTRVKVTSWDRSVPKPEDPGPYYVAIVACRECGKTRSLRWKDVVDLPLIWTEQN